jgi:transposase
MDATCYAREPVQYPSLHVFDVTHEAASIGTEYRNIVLNRINGGCLRLAVMSGEYPWHCHPHSDELFLVVEGRLVVELPAGRSLTLGPWPPVVVGIEATGSMGWFLGLMEELAIECRVGHPAAIRKAETRRQKHDRRDAALLLQLLVEDRFPAIWTPSTEYRDLRSLRLHRHQWVRMRTRAQNALHAIALAHGVRRGHTLWNRDGQALLASLPLAPHTADRRRELQALYQHVEAHIDRLDERVQHVANERPQNDVAHDPSGCRARHRASDRGLRRRSDSISRREGARELRWHDPERVLERQTSVTWHAQ